MQIFTYKAKKLQHIFICVQQKQFIGLQWFLLFLQFQGCLHHAPQGYFSLHQL